MHKAVVISLDGQESFIKEFPTYIKKPRSDMNYFKIE